MRSYFLRRLLLIPPTLLGITFMVFCITRIVPGGPMERMMMQAQMGAGERGGGRIGQSALSPEQIQQMTAFYGLDKPIHIAYLEWIGKVLRGDLGTSLRYGEPVWTRIRERLPVSATYGLITLVLTYSVCIPLGILKAIRHRTFLDNASSIVVFVGYAIPGYVLGSLLLLVFAFRLEWFPSGGFTGRDFGDLSVLGKILDIAYHGVLPLTCYVLGGFAFVTLLVKNNLMDNLAADYIRTAVAKGVSFRRAVLGHAFRNASVPLATGLGHVVGALLFGSFLIERIFDIDGIGLLGYESVVDRDYPVVLGILLLSSGLLLLGNILSDALVALVDPRIQFK